MRRRRRIALAALLSLACLIIPTVVLATEGLTLTSHVSFQPDELGASTNLSATASFHATETSVPPPISKLVVYLPAGMKIDVNGAGQCTAAKLEAGGPHACPADSRVGFGGGTGLLELGKEVIKEPYTLDFFLGPREGGHLTILAFVEAVSPAFIELVLVATEIHAPKPYGLGFSVEVPPIPTLPEASNASVEHVLITIGDKNVAYYKTVKGKRKLVYVKGVTVPKRCPNPSKGFPYKALVSFEDGTSLTDVGTIACPHE
ncbi:MAG TPA: hypothetical protein VGF95_09700 [Solirubrobacteraceae bacterium]